MKRWLILALGILLILLLSYITFLNKKESITQEILSQAQIIKKNPAFKDVYIKLKGENFAVTRELMILGRVSTKEDKLLASKILQDIKGVTKVNNLLKIQTLKPIIKEVETTAEIANTRKEESVEDKQIVELTNKINEEGNNSSDLNTTKIVQKESNTSKEKSENNTTELNSTQQQPIKILETNLTKENNETNQSSCQEQLDNVLTKGKIHFANNSSNIKKSSYKQLDQISTILKECSTTSLILIDGYSDNRGNAKYNQYLSQLRANKVKVYLVSKGIDKESIKAFGHGAKNPLASNATKEGREKNRRIEFTIKRITKGTK